MTLNKVIIAGNLTSDIELKKTQTGVSVCSFTVAVQRRYKDANGKYPTDFIPVTAWKEKSEFAARYFGKGAGICVVGSLQQREYTAQGQKRIVYEVIAEEISFVDKKSETPAAKQEMAESETQHELAAPQTGGFEDLSETDDLPF